VLLPALAAVVEISEGARNTPILRLTYVVNGRAHVHANVEVIEACERSIGDVKANVGVGKLVPQSGKASLPAGDELVGKARAAENEGRAESEERGGAVTRELRAEGKGVDSLESAIAVVGGGLMEAPRRMAVGVRGAGVLEAPVVGCHRLAIAQAPPAAHNASPVPHGGCVGFCRGWRA
jgi:hypothetical protein